MTKIKTKSKSKSKKEELETSVDQPEHESETVNNDQNDTISPSTNPFSSEKAPKRKKVKKPATEEGETQNNNDADGDNSSIMPTPPPSKRQKKREKKEQREQISGRSKDKEAEKTISYLTKWDAARDEWKYEKLRQIHIQKNIFDESIIPNEHSDVGIRYLATSKGHARTIITQAAEKVIKEIEEKITDENQEELTSSCQYERARKILQTMQDE